MALVSGAARGIGEAIAKLFAAEGACVTIGDIGVEAGQHVAQRITDVGGRALFATLDVKREDDWHAAIAATVEAFAKLDVLVNNAGVWRTELVDETSLEMWEEVMAVNSTGPFLGTKHAIPEMKKAGGGSIVNMSLRLGDRR